MAKPAKYRLIKEPSHNDPVGVKVSLDTEGATLDEMCMLFEQYLRASGFHFDGHIDIVETPDLLISSQAW